MEGAADKKHNLLGPSILGPPLFPMKNARVLFKRIVETFFFLSFRLIRTLLAYGGIFAELRSPKDQENHCIWHLFKEIFVFSLVVVAAAVAAAATFSSHQVRAEAIAPSSFWTSQVPSIFEATEMGWRTSWNPHDIDIVHGGPIGQSPVSRSSWPV